MTAREDYPTIAARRTSYYAEPALAGECVSILNEVDELRDQVVEMSIYGLQLGRMEAIRETGREKTETIDELREEIARLAARQIPEGYVYSGGRTEYRYGIPTEYVSYVKSP